MQQITQKWKEIEGFEGRYAVSDAGNVKSVERVAVNVNGIKRTLKSHVLKPRPSDTGYLNVALGAGNARSVHRLVARAFIPNPDGHEYVLHKNNIKTDNRVENLKWGTQSETCVQSVDNGNCVNSNKTHCKHGHEFNHANTGHRKVNGRPTRYCKKCCMDRYYARKAKK